MKYWDESWQPVTGCKKFDKGCANCYAVREIERRPELANHPRYIGLTENGDWTGEVRFNPGCLDQLERWRKPRLVFCCNMGDLFAATWDEITHVFAAINRARQHRVLILTKRAFMLPLMLTEKRERFNADVERLSGRPADFSNVWLGVTCCGVWTLRNIEQLARVEGFGGYWASFEPVLGSIAAHLGNSTFQVRADGSTPDFLQFLDWVVVGGESGPNYRVGIPGECERIVERTKAAGVPVFYKQGPGGTKAEIDGETFYEYPTELVEFKTNGEG